MITARKPRVKWLDWRNCYDDNWNGYIVPEAFAHPAKFARGLVERIYKHMLEQGWIKRGDTIFDPFGGIGNGGIIGASLGLKWVGVELEERFVNFAKQNFELHRKTWEQFGDPLPTIIHGDSRNAFKLVREASGCVSSPPFSGTEQPCASQTRAKKDYHAFTRGDGTKRDATMTGETLGQLGAMKEGDVDAAISSPPFVEPPGQLGSMKEGVIDAALSSPPYADQDLGGDGQRKFAGSKSAEENKATKNGKGLHGTYGTTSGQLADLKEGDIGGAVSSPPYEDSQVGTGKGERKGWRGYTDIGGGTYATDGQVSAMPPETFWQAARQIVEQTYLLLKPGAYAAFVCKDYVKNGKRVPFCDNWARLCEACGFEVVQRVRAWLVKEETHAGLFGEVTKKTERKSFFRRLHEKKPGAVKIDFEEVIFVRKPLNPEN